MADLEYIYLKPETSLPELTGAPFKAVIAIESDVTPEWQDKVCAWLVRSGCRYAMTWGLRCEAWHDGIDHANLAKFDYEDIPQEDFVMTTWHAEKPLEDPLWFSGQCAEHPSLHLKKTYIIHISAELKAVEFVDRYHAAQDDEIRSG